ncbi:MAG: polysaccharide deacetylase family protein [Bacteroidia bacterium]
MNYLKTIARNILFPTLYKLNIDKWNLHKSNKFNIILMYHGVVNDDSSWFSPTHIHINQFEKHIEYFKKNFNIIPLNELFYIVNNNIKTDKKNITITFDDGFKNNLYYALPVLKKYNVPASIFVTACCIENNEINCLWTEKILALMHFYPNNIIEYKNFTFINYKEKTSNQSIFEFIKHLGASERELFIDELVAKYDLKNKLKEIPADYWELFSKDELKKIAQEELIEIGSHGYLHYNLGLIDENTANQELIKSKNLLENTIQKEVKSIAYPDGSYNLNVKNLAEKTGYQHQLAVNYHFEEDKNDKRILNRFGISCTTTFESNILRLSRSFNKLGH